MKKIIFCLLTFYTMSVFSANDAATLEIIRAYIDLCAQKFESSSAGLPEEANFKFHPTSSYKTGKRILKTQRGESIPLFPTPPSTPPTPEVEGEWMGKTALHHAVLSGNLGAVQRLIEANAPINPRDHFQTTPLAIAESRGLAPIIEYLKSVGAKT